MHFICKFTPTVGVGPRSVLGVRNPLVGVVTTTGAATVPRIPDDRLSDQEPPVCLAKGDGCQTEEEGYK